MNDRDQAREREIKVLACIAGVLLIAAVIVLYLGLTAGG